jgi:hypothetical protein
MGAAIADLTMMDGQTAAVTGSIYPELEARFRIPTPHAAPVYRNLRNGKFGKLTEAGRVSQPHTQPRMRGRRLRQRRPDILIMNMNEPPSLLPMTSRRPWY